MNAILEMAELKRTGAHDTGGDRVFGRVTANCGADRRIDAVLGTGEVPDIVNAIAAATGRPERSPLARPPCRSRYFAAGQTPGERRPARRRCRPICMTPTRRARSSRRHFAYVKAAEAATCAFCIVPTLRGTTRPAVRVDSGRGQTAGGSRRAITQPDFAGHDLLRRGSR